MSSEQTTDFKSPLPLVSPVPKPPTPLLIPPQPIYSKPQQQGPAELPAFYEQFNYSEPTWACAPTSTDKYSLQVIKNGIPIESVKLDKSHIAVGRLVGCGIHLEHPSISRIHAVLQYGKGSALSTSKRAEGWHVIDLGSTHGTVLNKQRIASNQYVRVSVGHVLKFGSSTRLFIVEGPGEDQEPESPLTVTQIKKEMEKRKLKAEGLLDEDEEPGQGTKRPKFKKETEIKEGDNEQAKEETGEFSWGLNEEYGENETEDIDEGENMDFEDLQKREQFYKADPKRALKNFFDREGLEMNFDITEKGTGYRHSWICKLELPVTLQTGQHAFAVAEVNGSRKEATLQCAMDACRILDSHGVLRRSDAEATVTHSTVRKHTADNDYFEEDEDIFLDRTGQLEHKQKWRMRKAMGEEVTGTKAATYASLCDDLGRLDHQIADIQKELDRLSSAEAQKTNRNLVAEGDSLDTFMSSVKQDDAHSMQVKFQKSELRQKLSKLMKERNRTSNMAKVAKPFELPALRTAAVAGHGDKAKSRIWIGSLKRGNKVRFVEIEGDVAEVVPTEFQVEMDEPEGEQGQSTKPITIAPTPIKEPLNDIKQPSETKPPVSASTSHLPLPVSILKHSKPSLPKESFITPIISNKVPEPIISNEDSAIKEDLTLIESEVIKKPKVRVRERERKREKTVSSKKEDEYDPNNPDFATWLPPSNQMGDGKTHLNEKLGY